MSAAYGRFEGKEKRIEYGVKALNLFIDKYQDYIFQVYLVIKDLELDKKDLKGNSEYETLFEKIRDAAQETKDKIDSDNDKPGVQRVLTKIFLHNCKITVNSMINQTIKAIDAIMSG